MECDQALDKLSEKLNRGYAITLCLETPRFTAVCTEQLSGKKFIKSTSKTVQSVKLLLSLLPFHDSSPFLDFGFVMESPGFFFKVYDELNEEANCDIARS